MSIALIIETQSEIRRLLIAGSELAAEDFRLKKLLPQIKKAGESVPVFARVAEAMEKIVEPGGDRLSGKLLELANIVNAILYTQGQTGIEGDLSNIDSAGISFSTLIAFRRLKPVVEALTGKGPGRLEIIREAFSEGTFKDLRLVNPLISGLDDNYSEIADLAFSILEGYGTQIVPVLKGSIDINGGKGHARRVELISKLKGSREKDFYLDMIEKGAVEVKAGAVKALKDLPQCEPMLLELSMDRKKDIREAALLALSYLATEAAVKRVFEVFNSKEQISAALPVKVSSSKLITQMLLDEGEKVLETILKSEKGFSLFTKKVDPPAKEVLESFTTILNCMKGKKDPEIFEFFKKCLLHVKLLQQYKGGSGGESGAGTIAEIVAGNVISYDSCEAFELLDSIQGKYDDCLLAYSFAASIRIKDPSHVFQHYSGYLKAGRKSYEGQQILGIMDAYIDFEKQYRLNDIYTSKPYDYRIGKVNKDEIIWDKRWLKILVGIDETGLVCRLASKSVALCWDYLLKKLESMKDFNNFFLKDIIMGLLQAEYPETPAVVIKVLEHNLKKSGNWSGWYFNDFARALHFLPSNCSVLLEDLAKNHDSTIAGKLFEIANHLKYKDK